MADKKDPPRKRTRSARALETRFLKYAPPYAQNEARQAIRKVRQLQTEGVLRTGIYYLVLVDLVGSTQFAATHGNTASVERIERFITRSFDALNEASLKNIGLFVKEIGDAVLFVFSHFVDVLNWLHQYRTTLAQIEGSGAPYIVRTCVHVAEVALDDVNPISLGVSQAFKMEKAVNGGDVVLSQPAYCVAWPSLTRAHRAFRHYGSIELEGFTSPVDLYQLVITDEDDLERMVVESRRSS